MKDRIKGMYYKSAVVATALLVPAMAHAEPTGFTLPDLPTGQIYNIGGTILGALAVMWVLRKLIKTSNKS